MNDWGRIDARSLGIYRVLFALALLLMFPNFMWVRRFPDALYDPPPGPMRFFDGFPPTAVLVVVTATIAVCAACLLLGVRVRTASWVLTAALAYGYGLSNSLGKIDHNLLLVLTPAVLVLAGWSPGARVRPWVLQLWAFTIGVAMLTAAVPKLTASWLDPSTHAVRGFVTQQVLAYGQDTWTATLALRVTPPWLWEPVDWAAPLLEASIVVLAVLGLRWFRCGLVLLVLFHLGVLLTMNIPFATNIVVYGGFVSWAAAPSLAARARWVADQARPWMAAPIAAVSFAFTRLDIDVDSLVVVVSAVGVVAAVGVKLVQRRRVAASIPSQAARAKIRRPPVPEVVGTTVGHVAGIAPVVTPVVVRRVYDVPPTAAYPRNAAAKEGPHVVQVPPTTSPRAASQ